jgi:methionine synthase II (cobalamin-independent)
MDTTMMTSSDRILTTHTGSLPRPASLTDRHDPQAVRAAVRETVERQVAAGVDVIGDGEMSKPGYSTYVTERLSGFGGPPMTVPRWGYERFPEFARKMWGTGKGVTDVNPSCDGPVSYLDLAPVEADIANLRAAAAGAPEVAGVFMTAASPGVIDSTTNYVEHPELVAQRIGRYVDLVGWENVIAGTDCGFATFVTHVVVEPEITWAKLATLAEGARLASERHRARTR